MSLSRPSKTVRTAGGEETGFLLFFAALIAALPFAVAAFVDDSGWKAMRRTIKAGSLAAAVGSMFLLLGSGNVTALLLGFPGLIVVAFTSGLFFLGIRSVLGGVWD